MAKKVAEPTYVEAPLVIPKEKFKSILEAQIVKGEQLLAREVPIKNQPMGAFGGYYGVPRRDRVEYDETAKRQFVADFERWHGYNVEVYKTSFAAPNSTYRHEYENKIGFGFGTDIVGEYKEDIERLNNQMRGDIEKLPLIKCSIDENVLPITPQDEELSNRIFIVHGHDGELKEKVARTLAQLGLEPVILHEQPDGGRTIIEKFEVNAEDCKFAVILLTADDLGQSTEEKEKGEEPRARARQNVVFEMGYFMGRLGRPRVVVLLDRGVDKPGDLDGLVYVPTADDFEWKARLVKELKNCGYKVDANKII